MHSNTFALVRHGQTDWNLAGRIQGRTEVPLNQVGVAQARAVAEHLASPSSPTGSRHTALPWAELSWDAVLTSPLGRARGTAEIIAARLGLGEPHERPGLIERDFGVAEGLSGPELVAARVGGEYLGAEQRGAVAARAAAVLEAWHLSHDAHDSSGTVVVSHGACLRLLLRHLLGRELGPIDNATVTLLHRDAEGWSLKAFNEAPKG